MYIDIEDLDDCRTNERNGTYGGKAGEKEGIFCFGEYWIVKYPQSTRGELNPYTTSPLSEFIGSHIYQMLGIDAHETMLGIRNDKLVVACKDFCKHEGSLREIRTLKNVYNKDLSLKLEMSLSSTSTSSQSVDMNNMMIHLKHNPLLSQVPNIQNRFWEQFIVDILINNNDRNSGNWGVLYEDGIYRLAPVYDNGAAFSPKLPDSAFEKRLIDKSRLQQSIDTSTTVYEKDNKKLYAKDILSIENEDLFHVASYLIPTIENKMGEIKDFIRDLPENYDDIYVCSGVRGQFYIETMELKVEQYLKPTLEKAREYLNEHEPLRRTFGRGR